MVYKKRKLGKKGIGGDIDWIIAMGIFLIFMSLVFTLFKPGIRSSFDYKSLQGIVEENFLNDTKWEIYKQPVFIEDTNLDPMYSEGSPPNQKTCAKTSVCTSPQKFGSKTFILDGITYNSHGDMVSSDNSFPLFTSFFAGKNATEVKQRMRMYYITEGEKGGGVTTNAILNVNFHGITGMAPAEASNQCSDDTPCSAGKLCVNEKCEDLPKKAVGATCDNKDECSSNKCTNGLCVPKTFFKQGHLCSSSVECAQGMVCDTTDTTEKKCCVQDTNNPNNPDRCKKQGGEIKSGQKKERSMPQTNSPENDKIKNENRENLGENEIDYKIYGDDTTKKLGLTEVSFANGEQKRYTLVYSSEIISPDNAESAETQPSAGTFKACLVNDYDTTKKVKGTVCQARYSLGVREAVNGISTKKYGKIVPTESGGKSCTDREYECLKEKWGYPLVKDFRIDIFNTDVGISLTVPKNAMDTNRTQAAVRVRQFNDFILTEEGLKVPVTVSIKVW